MYIYIYTYIYIHTYVYTHFVRCYMLYVKLSTLVHAIPTVHHIGYARPRRFSDRWQGGYLVVNSQFARNQSEKTGPAPVRLELSVHS